MSKEDLGTSPAGASATVGDSIPGAERSAKHTPEVWTAEHPMDGTWNIICNGWSFATLHYDYRYTCNAETHSRARLITAAPAMRRALQITGAFLKLVAEGDYFDLSRHHERAIIRHNGEVIAECSLAQALDMANDALETGT